MNRALPLSAGAVVLLLLMTMSLLSCATSASELRASHRAHAATVAAAANANAQPPRVLWNTANLSITSLGTPVAANNRIFVAGPDAVNTSMHRIFAFDSVTGLMLWSLAVEGAVGSIAASSEVADDAALFVGTDSGLIAYAQRNGTQLWSFQVTEGQRFPSLAGQPGYPVYRSTPNGVVFCTWSNTPLMALDAVTGALLHLTALAADGAVFLSHAGTHAWFVAVDPVTHIRSATCVDAENMTTLVWTVPYNANTTRLIANEYGVVVLSTPYPDNAAVERLQSLNPDSGSQNWDAYLAGYSGGETTSMSTFNFALDQVYFAFPTSASAWAVRCKCLFVETDHWDLSVDVAPGRSRLSGSAPAVPQQLSIASFYSVTFLHNYAGGQLWAVDSIMGNVLWQWNVPSPTAGVLVDHGFYFFGSAASLVAVAAF